VAVVTLVLTVLLSWSSVNLCNIKLRPSAFFFQDHVCSLSKVPFRGAPCSDAAGHQVPYGAIMKQVNSSLSGALWDEVQKSPFYEYKVSISL